MLSSQEDFFVPMRKVLVFSKKCCVSLSVGREGGREGEGHQAIR